MTSEQLKPFKSKIRDVLKALAYLKKGSLKVLNKEIRAVEVKVSTTTI